MSSIFPQIFEQKKSKIRILILGTYTPEEFEKKLINLRDCLIENGFKETKLVADFEDDPLFHPTNMSIHFQRKSFHYVKRAQALLFVYFKGANHEGVTRELSYMIENVINKTNCSAILHEGLELSTMIKADIEGHRLREYSFTDDKDLCEGAVGYCSDFVYHLFDQL